MLAKPAISTIGIPISKSNLLAGGMRSHPSAVASEREGGIICAATVAAGRRLSPAHLDNLGSMVT